MKITRINNEKSMKVVELKNIFAYVIGDKHEVTIFDINQQENYAIDVISQDGNCIIVQYMDGIEENRRIKEFKQVIEATIRQSSYNENSHRVVFYNRCNGSFTIPQEFTIDNEKIVVYCK